MEKFNKNQYIKKGTLKTVTLKEQCPEVPFTEIKVNVLSEGSQLWLQPEGYGEKCAMDGHGWPIGIEIWQGRLRLIVFSDINSEEPQIIDLERSKESCRIEDAQGCDCTDYCAAAEYLASKGRKIFTGRMKGGLWNARCMDACVLSKKQNDKEAYELLLKSGNQYVLGLSDSRKLLWQKIKDSASAILEPVKPNVVTNQNIR